MRLSGLVVPGQESGPAADVHYRRGEYKRPAFEALVVKHVPVAVPPEDQVAKALLLEEAGETESFRTALKPPPICSYVP